MATDDRDEDEEIRPEPSDEEALRLAGEELHRMREEPRGRSDGEEPPS